MTIYIMFDGLSIWQNSNKYLVLMSYRQASQLVRELAYNGKQPEYTLTFKNGLVLEY